MFGRIILKKKTLKFGQIFGKFSTSENIFEKSRLWLKFSEISILVKIFGKPQLSDSSENLDLVQNIQKSGFWTKFSQITILVKKKWKSPFSWRFSKISTEVKIFAQIFRKSIFQSKF